jgi:multiple sugar transport system substrate-binding protein
MARLASALLASALLVTPLAAKGADLTVWWEKGFYPREDQALKELVAAFESAHSLKVELVQPSQQDLPEQVRAALKAGTPPDLARGGLEGEIPNWAEDGTLVDLSEIIEPLKGQFYPEPLERVHARSTAGKDGYYALPIGRTTVHVHVWKGLLEKAGLSAQDIPREWEAFWSFWCDKVQPAVRQATGRNDIYGIGAPMGPESDDTLDTLDIFTHARGIEYISPKGKFLLDDPEVRKGIVAAVDEYSNLYRRGCTPPDSISWENPGNNKAFLGQQVVMTPNSTLSIVAALLADRPNDYYNSAATVEWPLGPDGKPFYISVGGISSMFLFQGGKHVEAAKDFLRFVLSEGHLAHYIEASNGRYLPTMPALTETAFWTDPRDPHRPVSLRQAKERSGGYSYIAANPHWSKVEDAYIWAKAVTQAAQGYPADKAVDEAVVQTKKLLGE